jgi:hypothetical protein
LFFMFGGSTISVRRKLLAWWLLVLLVRVLAPEAAVLQLHSHTHTEVEPAVRQPRLAHKALLTPKHQHCHTEQLYQLPFVPAAMASLPAPVRLLAYATYRPQASVCRPAHLLDGACLRGPPALG